MIGGIPGALIGMGIPEYEAQRYEAKIKQGGILISVCVGGAVDAQLAENIFKEEDALDIASLTEVLAPKRNSALRRPAPEPLLPTPTSLQPTLVGAGGAIE
jgi:hypothetical protein